MSSSFTTALGIGNKLGSTITQASDTSAIDEIFQSLSKNGSEKDIDNATAQILSKVSPERQKVALTILQSKKNQFMKEKQRNDITKLGLPPEIVDLSESERREFIKSHLEKTKQEEEKKLLPSRKETFKNLGMDENIADLSPNERIAYINSFTKQKFAEPKEEKVSDFQKARQISSAKKFDEAEALYQKSKGSLKDLDRIEELSNQLSGPFGYVKNLTNRSAATELNALGLSSLEPVIKIFNPVGAIPTQKINLLKGKFVPKTSDLKSTVTGKINALRRITKKAEERALKQMQLISKYNGQVPIEEIENFNNNSEKELNDLLKLNPNKINEENEIEYIYMKIPDGRKIRVDKNDVEKIKEFKSKNAVII